MTPTQVFSCQYCEVFKNNFLIEHLRTAAFILILVKSASRMKNHITCYKIGCWFAIILMNAADLIMRLKKLALTLSYKMLKNGQRYLQCSTFYNITHELWLQHINVYIARKFLRTTNFSKFQEHPIWRTFGNSCFWQEQIVEKEPHEHI